MKIGEFARINQVSTKMLRHYDDIGLLKPQSVSNETGYRSYTLDQSNILQWIITLKGLDFSLSDIKEILSGPVDAADLVKKLSYKRMEIIQTLKEDLAKSYHIERLLKHIEKEGFTMNKTIDLRHVSTSDLTLLKNQMPTKDDLLMHANETLKHLDKGLTFGMFFIDLRQFQAINEHFGYEVGDKVLISLFSVLKDAMSGHPLNHSIARMGGDEFVIYAEGKIEDLKNVATLIKKHVQGIDYKSLGCTEPIEVSIGVSIKNASPTLELDAIIQNSYLLVTKAKKSKDQDYIFFDV